MDGIAQQPASMTMESPTDGDVFLAYLEQVLCPRLRPGQVAVMDNLAARHGSILIGKPFHPSR